MQIIGFLQIRNEMRSGHLKRFLDINGPLFDALFVYDDFSDDGTFELITAHATKVIRGESRQFGHELVNKSLLLDVVKQYGEHGDAILWLDADEVIYASRQELEKVISDAFDIGYDAIELPHINLWRSNDWFRTDNLYDDLRPVRIWRLSDNLSFPHKPGLHQQMHPEGIRAVKRLEGPAVVHFGFASTELIVTKHANYRRHWQAGHVLHRLISEEGRKLVELASRERALGSRFRDLHPFEKNSQEPKVLSSAEWYSRSNKELSNILEEIASPKVTVVSLIYASTKWLAFQYAELLRIQRDMPMGDVEILFVANDASPDVISFLEENGIPHIKISTKAHPDEWFINSVYRAYNKAVEVAEGEYVLLVNSDMAYAPGALATLMREAAPNRFLAGRLVELGVMPTGKFGIERDFGALPGKFRRRDFYKYANKISEHKVESHGLYMPLLVNKQTFLNLGGYPAGNLVMGTLEQYLATGQAHYAVAGQPSVPGDVALMAKASASGISHETVFDSITYHFQAGERRDRSRKRTSGSGVAIVNDSLIGINGEEVLWGQVSKRLQKLGIRVTNISTGFPKTTLESLTSPLRLWSRAQRELRKINRPRLVFSNATYQVPLLGRWRNAMVRQDYPSTKGYRLLQKWSLALADRIFANDANFVARVSGVKTEWLLVPLAETWWPSPNRESRKIESARKIEILFVGAFNDTKGWSRLSEIVKCSQTWNWTLVSKYSEDQHNLDLSVNTQVRVERCLSAAQLKYEYEKADIVVVASPYETQNLVSLEAASQGAVIVSTPTGFLGSFGEGRHEFGIVSADLREGIVEAINNLEIFQPRKFIEDYDLVGESGWSNWVEKLTNELRESFLAEGKPTYVLAFISRLRAYGVWLARRILRNWVFPVLIVVKQKLVRINH